MLELELAAGTIKRRARFEEYVDESFVRNVAPARIAL
jgi:hypothetical protein